MLDFLIGPAILATAVWYYHVILRDYLLAGWFKFGYEKFGKYEGNWKEYLYMPIWGCQYCTAGQLSLWYYLLCRWQEYSLNLHIIFIIITTIFVKIIWKHLEE